MKSALELGAELMISHFKYISQFQRGISICGLFFLIARLARGPGFTPPPSPGEFDGLVIQSRHRADLLCLSHIRIISNEVFVIVGPV